MPPRAHPKGVSLLLLVEVLEFVGSALDPEVVAEVLLSSGVPEEVALLLVVVDSVSGVEEVDAFEELSTSAEAEFVVLLAVLGEELVELVSGSASGDPEALSWPVEDGEDAEEVEL